MKRSGDWGTSPPNFTHLQLIGGPQFFPVLFSHQRLDLVAGQVDAVVEVSAPEYVIVTQEVPVVVKIE